MPRLLAHSGLGLAASPVLLVAPKSHMGFHEVTLDTQGHRLTHVREALPLPTVCTAQTCTLHRLTQSRAVESGKRFQRFPDDI